MANPFRTQSKNPFRQGEITAQPATQESMDAWRDKVMGTAGMDAIGRALVTKAQSAFGNAGGDTARAVYQAPATFARGVGGGLVAANAGINQMLRDTPRLARCRAWVIGYRVHLIRARKMPQICRQQPRPTIKPI